ncbi:MAG: RDD family protein [Clostridia bacterium]|nr:RDD family protein [Clostridia bacterium]
MIYDLQKASMWKRISAFLCDIILFCIVAVGIALLLSSLLGVDAQQEKMVATCNRYAEEYDLDAFLTKEELDGAIFFSVTEERRATLTEAQQKNLQAAADALEKDEDYLYAYSMTIQLSLLIITFSILFTHLILEFTVPLFFKNGQTLGKKIFGVGVMRIDGVKISPVVLFVRTILGKYAVETMIPVFALISIFVLGTATIVTLALLFVLIVAQIALLIFTKENALLHDILAGTVTVDFASQMIFDTPEDLLEYKRKLHAESVAENTQNS